MCHIINTTTGKSIIQCQYDHKDQASAGYVSNPSSVTDCHIQKCSNDPKDSTGRSRRYSHTSGLYIPPCRQNIPRQSTYEIHGKGLLASDILFTIAGFFVFDIKTGLYSLLGLTMRSTLIDSLIESLNRSKYFHVVCSEPEPICEFIKNDLKRGATIVLAQGAFTGDDKYIILTVLSPNEAIKLRNFIKAHTTGAFLLISNTSEIIGKGFHSV